MPIFLVTGGRVKDHPCETLASPPLHGQGQLWEVAPMIETSETDHGPDVWIEIDQSASGDSDSDWRTCCTLTGSYRYHAQIIGSALEKHVVTEATPVRARVFLTPKYGGLAVAMATFRRTASGERTSAFVYAQGFDAMHYTEGNSENLKYYTDLMSAAPDGDAVPGPDPKGDNTSSEPAPNPAQDPLPGMTAIESEEGIRFYVGQDELTKLQTLARERAHAHAVQVSQENVMMWAQSVESALAKAQEFAQGLPDGSEWYQSQAAITLLAHACAGFTAAFIGWSVHQA